MHSLVVRTSVVRTTKASVARAAETMDQRPDFAGESPEHGNG
jgi:hypothetical protein